MSFPIKYPMVNGHRFSWASIEFRLNNLLCVGVKSLNYKASLTPGLVRGTGANPIGRTKGEAEYTGDIELLRLEWEVLLQSLGAPVRGYGEVAFPISVLYFEVGSPTVLDVINGVRISESDVSNAQGTDASTIKSPFTAMRIIMNGSEITSPQGFGI